MDAGALESPDCRVCHATLGLIMDGEWPEGGPICYDCLADERDDLLAAIRAGGIYTNALIRHQSGAPIGTFTATASKELNRLLVDWHNKAADVLRRLKIVIPEQETP